MLTRFSLLFKQHYIKFILLAVWISLLSTTQSFDLLIQYGSFLFLGVIGAIFANATGAGGGVVFVPFFNQLDLSSDTIVATSFAIQCCGMTAGAISWYRHYCELKKQARRQQAKLNDFEQWKGLSTGLLLCAPASVGGILLAQFILYEYTNLVQQALHVYFAIFSVILAIAIYTSIPLMKRQATKNHLASMDVVALPMIGFLGGIITAWLSVGVGELVAVYLILRGFNVSFSIALAVILSAISVQAAIFYHLFISQAIYFQILVFAGAGAIIGGLIAKHVVLYFSPVKLKIFFGTWVLIMGLAGLPLW